MDISTFAVEKDWLMSCGTKFTIGETCNFPIGHDGELYQGKKIVLEQVPMSHLEFQENFKRGLQDVWQKCDEETDV